MLIWSSFVFKAEPNLVHHPFCPFLVSNKKSPRGLISNFYSKNMFIKLALRLGRFTDILKGTFKNKLQIEINFPFKKLILKTIWKVAFESSRKPY